MKLFKVIFFLTLSQLSYSQNLELDYTLGASYGFNKSFHQDNSSNIINISRPSPMFSISMRFNINENKNHLEFIFLKMREYAGAKFIDGTRISKKLSGSIDNSYALSYGHSLKVFKISNLYINLGLGTEIVKDRGTSNTSLSDLRLDDYQKNKRFQPFLYGAFTKDFNWDRHHLRIKLIGRIGFKYNQFYHFSATDRNANTYETIIAKKGDAIALAISYGYEIFRFKKGKFKK